VINLNLFRKPVAVDSAQHGDLRLAHGTVDWSIAAQTNAAFVAAVEFGDACCDFPLLFVDAGKDDKTGAPLVASIAALGLEQRQNLFVEGGTWRSGYVPALLRAYPFGLARADDGRVLVVIDEAFEGWSRTEGQPLFDAERKPSPLLEEVRERLETVEAEIGRTRAVCSLLLAEGLLRPMRFDAELPDGGKVTVEGFMTLDEDKFAALPDAKVLELHKAGVLALVHAHQISLRHMRRMADWHVARRAAAGSEAGSAPTPAPQPTAPR
jgi:hypothetical protein